MSDVFLFHYTIINKNILLTYSVSVHLLLTRSALILADAVIFQNPFSRLIKKKKNPGHFLFITTLSESNVRYNWVITATSGRVKQASEIWIIC